MLIYKPLWVHNNVVLKLIDSSYFISYHNVYFFLYISNVGVSLRKYRICYLKIVSAINKFTPSLTTCLGLFWMNGSVDVHITLQFMWSLLFPDIAFIWFANFSCTIDWKKGKNVTVKLVKKTQKHKNRGTKRTVTQTVKTDSFFNFFDPPKGIQCYVCEKYPVDLRNHIQLLLHGFQSFKNYS